MNRKLFTIIAFAENKPGVAYRIADLFLKRKINIESLTVSETEKTGISRFTITVKTDDSTLEKLVKQLYRIIEVTKVYEREDYQIIAREIAFVKVSTKNPEQRRQAEDLAEVFAAKVIYVDKDSLTLQISGKEEQIQSLIQLLKPLGIKELVRSGRIAIDKRQPDSNLYQPAVVSDTVSSIEVSAIKRMQLLSQETDGCISLAQGVPGFATPDHIKQAAKQAIDQGLADKYTTGYGIEPLRQAIVDKLARKNGLKRTINEVIVTHGAIEGLMATFMALFNPQDQIVVLSPDYASHVTQVTIARHGGKPVFVPLKETDQGWLLDNDRLLGAISAQTKAILVCNPSNPLGKVYTREELEQIVAVADKYNLFIISDEMYEDFVFDQSQYISIASLPGAEQRTISVFGVSKSYAMTGWRIGYLSAPRRIVQQIFKIHDSLTTCPTAVSQYAALAAITGDQSAVGQFRQAFLRNRQIVMDMVDKTEHLSLTPPQGAYYAFPKIVPDTDDYYLAIELIKHAGVAVVPGSAFGAGGAGHIRISFGGESKILKQGMQRLIDYLEQKF